MTISMQRWVDLGLFSSRAILKTLKLTFTLFLFGAEYKRNSVKERPRSLLVVFSGKTLNRTPTSVSGGQSIIPVALIQSD